LAELGLEGNPELEVPPAELVAKLTLDKCCAFLKAFDEAADIGIFDGSSLNLTLFPLGTFRIATLTNLSIRDNHIMHIPDEISNIKNLKYFDLRQNPCRRLPPTLCTLNIIEIHCDQETFTCPPPLIISQGLQKINWFLRKFFAARLTGKVMRNLLFLNSLKATLIVSKHLMSRLLDFRKYQQESNCAQH
jgi:Leucine-rich repeat (LRR) protein